MPDDSYTNRYTLPAVSYEVNAWRSFKSAYELERATLELSLLANIPPSGVTPDIANQRMAVFKIALKLICNERDKHMDKAVALWTQYRTMRPPQEPNA